MRDDHERMAVIYRLIERAFYNNDLSFFTPDEIEDIQQTLATKLYTSEFDPKRHGFKTYVARSARNALSNARRYKSRRLRFEKKYKECTSGNLRSNETSIDHIPKEEIREIRLWIHDQISSRVLAARRVKRRAKDVLLIKFADKFRHKGYDTAEIIRRKLMTPDEARERCGKLRSIVRSVYQEALKKFGRSIEDLKLITAHTRDIKLLDASVILTWLLLNFHPESISLAGSIADDFGLEPAEPVVEPSRSLLSRTVALLVLLAAGIISYVALRSGCSNEKSSRDSSQPMIEAKGQKRRPPRLQSEHRMHAMAPTSERNSNGSGFCPKDVWLAQVPSQCKESAAGNLDGIICTDASFLASLQGDVSVGILQPSTSECNSSEVSHFIWPKYDACTKSCTPETVVDGRCLGIRMKCRPGSCEGQDGCTCGDKVSHPSMVTFRDLKYPAVYHLRLSDRSTAIAIEMLAAGQCVYEDTPRGGVLRECRPEGPTSRKLPCEQGDR